MCNSAIKPIKTVIILLSVLALTSCGKEASKDEAYCFSIVFEKINNSPTATMYCKAQSADGGDNGSLSDIKLSFSKASFISAIKEADNSDYEIYYNSTKAIYFPTDVSDEEIKQIMLYFLEHTKYQSCVSVFTPDNKVTDTKTLHTEAQKICTDEKIKFNEKKNYTFAVKMLKDIYG